MESNVRVVELMKAIEQCQENRREQLILPITNHPIDPTFPKETTKLLKDYEDQRVSRWIMNLTERRVKTNQRIKTSRNFCAYLVPLLKEASWRFP